MLATHALQGGAVRLRIIFYLENNVHQLVRDFELLSRRAICKRFLL